MKRQFGWIAVAALALAGVTLARASAPGDGKKKQAPADSESVQRGKAVFDKKCAVCHSATSEAKKIGPGLKGLNARGTFSANGNKVTEESLKAWIENGNNLMPPFKDVLNADEVRDVIRYVKTL